MRPLQGVDTGEAQKLQPNLYPKSVKNGFSTAYLPITPAVCMHRYKVNDLHQKITKTVVKL